MAALVTPPDRKNPLRDTAVALRNGAKVLRSHETQQGEHLQPGFGRALRMTARLFGISAVTLGFYGLYVMLWPFAAFHDAHRRALRRSLLRWWGAGFLRVCNISLEVEGQAPQAPFFLVANHVGYLDIIVLSRVLGCVFIAKGDMESWPLLGWMMRNAHQLFIRREDFRDSARAIAEVENTLRSGDGMVVFAEARCTCGAEVVPFKTALFQAPANLGFPVHYAALYYETPAGEPTASDTVAWWRWEPLEQQMGRMLRLRSAKARVRFCTTPVQGGDRKFLARASHAGVCALFEPLEQGILPELPAPEGLPKHLRG